MPSSKPDAHQTVDAFEAGDGPPIGIDVSMHTSKAEEAHSFSNINEHPVDDISLEIFYQPHRLTLLLFSVAAVMSCAFVR